MTTPPAGKPALAPVELTREELSLLLVHVQTQYAELSRALDNLQDEEGDSMTKWNVTRTLKRQVELLGDLSLKLEGAAKDVGWR